MCHPDIPDLHAHLPCRLPVQEVYCKLRTKAVEERPEVLLAYDPLRGKASISLELSL